MGAGMELRIRCPQCRTVLKVKPGTRPTCPGCGFAGAGSPDPEQGQPVEFTASSEPRGPVTFTASSEPRTTQSTPGQPVKFSRAEPAAQGWGEGGEAGWQPVEGAPHEGAWEDTGGGWQADPGQASAPPAQPPEEPKRKRGWFGR